jgi:molybdopterin molybdotransferase
MRVFNSLLTPEAARARYWTHLRLKPRGIERVPLVDALDRVLAEDLVADADLPPFNRSTVDGFALRAADVATAGNGATADLRVIGKVEMGEVLSLRVKPGESIRVPTGGMVPDGADAVVMQEYTETTGEVVRIRRGVRSGENIVGRAEDVRGGETVLRAGRRLRPQDLGILAGLGHARVAVYLRPRVAIFSSGDELVPPSAQSRPGQLRDMNSYILAALVRQAGAEATTNPILPDDLAQVSKALRQALEHFDVLIISGGSSVGERDVVVDAIQNLGPPGIIVHGVAVKPGKPTVLALAGKTPVIGLPGNPVSAMVIFGLFVRPVIEALAGLDETPRRMTVPARSARRLPGGGEREEHVRVRLESREGELWAHPLPSKSGLITSMVRADGIAVVKPHSSVDEGEVVEVELFG